MCSSYQQPQVRVCFTGIPGSGKTTAASAFFAAYRKINPKSSSELLPERCRYWHYEGRNRPTFYEEYELWGRQIADEYRILQQGVDVLITDCPPSLILFYIKSLRPDSHEWEHLLPLTLEWETKFHPVYFFMRRTQNVILPYGRWHTTEDPQQWKQFEADLEEFYQTCFPQFTMKFFNVEDFHRVADQLCRGAKLWY